MPHDDEGGKVTEVFEERLDYDTHLRYAQSLEKWSLSLAITCKLKPKLQKLVGMKEVKNKTHLIKLIYNSLEDEFAIVQADSSYSTASVLWLPTKSYYLLYHLLSLIEYLLTGDKHAMRISHRKCLDTFTKRIKADEVVFSCQRFNTIFNCSIFDFRSQSGEHLRSMVSDDVIHNLLMKKVANYKIEDYVTLFKVNRRTPKGREAYRKFVSQLQVSIIDYFYLMRIKSSYKNLSFIDGIDDGRTKNYFETYYRTTLSFYNCLSTLKNKLLATMPE
jgi:hypothetical protein